MKRSTKILIGIIIAVLFLFSLFEVLRHQSNKPAATVAIPTSNGSVPVRNFNQNPVQQESDETDVEHSSQFDIVYYPKEQTFSITILAEPVQQARQAAESEFLKNLQIDQSQACQLTVSLYVPYGVDPNLSGRNYGLSFCPDGQPFPSGE